MLYLQVMNKQKRPDRKRKTVTSTCPHLDDVHIEHVPKAFQPNRGRQGATSTSGWNCFNRDFTCVRPTTSASWLVRYWSCYCSYSFCLFYFNIKWKNMTIRNHQSLRCTGYIGEEAQTSASAERASSATTHLSPSFIYTSTQPEHAFFSPSCTQATLPSTPCY